MYQLAVALNRIGKRDLSFQVHQRALAIREELVRELPDMPKHQMALKQSRQAIEAH